MERRERARLNPVTAGIAGAVITVLAALSSRESNSISEDYRPDLYTDNPQVTQPLPSQAASIQPSQIELAPAQPTVYWIFAHPDDETLAAAGAMKASQDQGNINIVVIISSGENTLVRQRLGLTREQTRAAREKETRAALSVIGITDVRFMGIPDGTVTVEFTRQVINNLAGGNEGETSFVGHSPKDSYAGLNCGHPDHCAVATALTQAYSEGQVKGLKLYRIGQLMGGPQAGNCQQLTSDQMAVKQAMRTQYTIVRTGEGRYGIAGQSVPGAWAATRSKPECFDNPSP